MPDIPARTTLTPSRLLKNRAFSKEIRRKSEKLL
jgi:hypothetical protein